MKNKIKNILIKIVKCKATLFVLILLLIFSTWLIVKKQLLVKGETNREYFIVLQDDAKKLLIKSSSFETLTALSENNIKIYPEDKISEELILDPVLEGGAGQKIIIKRAPVFYIEVDGGIKDIRIWEPTVSNILTKSKVILAPKDELNYKNEETLTPGATIVITRVNEADIDTFESVAFETIYNGDSNVPFGQKKITQNGVNGKVKKTYRILYKNGVEVSRRLILKETVNLKQDKIIASGIITGRANFGYYSGMVTSFYKGMTGKYLLVTNLSNGKQVKVKIIGSGPFNGPLMDMGTEPFQIIGGSLRDGYIPKVSVQLID